MKKKIKLRYVTPDMEEEIKKYCDEKGDSYGCKDCPLLMFDRCRNTEDKLSWVNNKDMFSDKFLDQEIELDFKDEPIITYEEREYLSQVIAPFKERVVSVTKTYVLNFWMYIKIGYITSHDEYKCCYIPIFEKDKMYLGMEEERNYTIEELGLE